MEIFLRVTLLAILTLFSSTAFGFGSFSCEHSGIKTKVDIYLSVDKRLSEGFKPDMLRIGFVSESSNKSLTGAPTYSLSRLEDNKTLVQMYLSEVVNGKPSVLGVKLLMDFEKEGVDQASLESNGGKICDLKEITKQ